MDSGQLVDIFTLGFSLGYRLWKVNIHYAKNEAIVNFQVQDFLYPGFNLGCWTETRCSFHKKCVYRSDSNSIINFEAWTRSNIRPDLLTIVHSSSFCCFFAQFLLNLSFSRRICPCNLILETFLDKFVCDIWIGRTKLGFIKGNKVENWSGSWSEAKMKNSIRITSVS